MRCIFLLFIIFFLSTSCNKTEIAANETTNLDIIFRATYEGERLIIGKTYYYATKPIIFTRISFFIADLQLTTEVLETKLSDVEFIDITSTHISETLAAKGTSIQFKDIPINEYNGLNFGVGVPSTLNETVPSDYPDNHALGMLNSEEYSEDLGSYIFSRIEGVFDKEGENIEFAYHAGIDRNYQEIKIDDFKLSEKQKDINATFELDIKQMLTLIGGGLIQLEPYNPKDPNQRAVIILMMDNFHKALHLIED